MSNRISARVNSPPEVINLVSAIDSGLDLEQTALHDLRHIFKVQGANHSNNRNFKNSKPYDDLVDAVRNNSCTMREAVFNVHVDGIDCALMGHAECKEHSFYMITASEDEPESAWNDFNPLKHMGTKISDIVFAREREDHGQSLGHEAQKITGWYNTQSGALLFRQKSHFDQTRAVLEKAASDTSENQSVSRIKKMIPFLAKLSF